MSALKAKFALLIALGAVCCFHSPESLLAQGIGGGGGGIGGGGLIQRVVGGVKIDANGVVTNTTTQLDPAVRRAIEEASRSIRSEGEIGSSTDLRLISLGKLEQAIAQAKAANQTLAPEYQYLAGLQRIEFVILSPEGDDIFIGGPAEGWTVNDQGVVVGTQSGNPVIHLEDFLVALRSSEASRTGEGISVSIDPTEGGVKAIKNLFQTLKSRNIAFQPQMSAEFERAMGNQMVSLTGIPIDSRFAQVLVAADYKMKRYSMGFEKAPVNDLPSVMEMAAAKKASLDNAAPRFWMECNYQPVAKSEAGNVWQIRGQGVKTLTEESRFSQTGQRQTTGKQNPYAARWADQMTAKFEQLAAAEPSFRELRNAMDMSVVAAIIARENLVEKTGLSLTSMLDSTGVKLPSWNVPKSVPAQCSYLRSSNGWMVSASGGVQLDPWGVAQNQEVDPQINQLIAAATPSSDRWWWNAGK